jgi:dTDP-4-amino-4,6-dideoxygalactose transaminase
LLRGLRRIQGAGHVIIPALCCERVALAAIYAGLEPRIADIDADTLCISPHWLSKNIDGSTRAVILVGIFGNLFDPEPFQRLRRIHNTLFVEDIAQSVGGQYRNQMIGSSFDVTLLSFAAGKIIRGQSGALVIRSELAAQALQQGDEELPQSPSRRCLELKTLSLRNLVHGLCDLYRADQSTEISTLFNASTPYYAQLVVRAGEDYQADDIKYQFESIDDVRWERHLKYDFYLTNICNPYVRVVQFSPGAMCWRCCLVCQNSDQTYWLTQSLRDRRVPASNHYFSLARLIHNESLSTADSVWPRLINLWVDATVTDQLLDTTVEIINSFPGSA